MAQFTWTLDVETGVLKNHALSAKLYEVAVENSVFMDHVTPVGGYGRGKGETVTWTRIKAIAEPTDPELVETERIPEDTYAISTGSATVKEIGRAVPITSFARDLLHFDLMNSVQRQLMRQMTLSLDTLAAAAFKRTYIKYTPTGATSRSIATTGTAATSATANLNGWHFEEIQDYMYDTLLVPPMSDGSYVGIFRTLALRGLMRDSDWEEWHKYTDPSGKFNAEAGKYEGIRCIKTNHNAALGKIGTSSVCGEGVVFGEDAVGLAEAVTPELRVDAFAEDLGRSRTGGWYGILRMEPFFNTGSAGEDKILHVAST
jgi:N4-gp56 family major capsid protein